MKRRSNHAMKRRLAPVWHQGKTWWDESIRIVLAHPRRAAGVGAICGGLLLLVATTTLPMALAPTSPEIARRLNPRDPAVLQRAVEEARTAFFGFNQPSAPPSQDDVAIVDPAPAPTATPNKPGPVDTIASLPEAPPVLHAASDAPTAADDDDAEHLREKIRERASALMVADPLNPLPFRVKGEVTADPDAQRALMQEAVRRSRRDPAALAWLALDDLRHERYEAALQQIDMLLRASPRFGAAIAPLFVALAEAPEGRPVLIRWLLNAPGWRPLVFSSISRGMTHADTPFQVMLELRNAGQPLAEQEVDQYLSLLLGRKLPDYAYNVWLQSLPPEALGQIGYLINPGFQQEPGGGPFDWRIAPGRNAIGEFLQLRELGGQRAFHVVFGSGRVRFTQLSQILILPPGRYRLEGRLRGSISGKRGLVWQVQCLYRRAPPLGQTEQLLGHALTWRVFDFEFEVPDESDCAAQILRLFHDSRSASEEIVNGEAWFSDLSLQRMTTPTN